MISSSWGGTRCWRRGWWRVRESFSVEVELRNVFDCSSLRTFAAHTQKLIEVVSLDEERLDSMTEEEAEQLLSELKRNPIEEWLR